MFPSPEYRLIEKHLLNLAAIERTTDLIVSDYSARQ